MVNELKKIKGHKYFKKILEDDPDIIILTGSLLLNLEDEHSDIDLLFLFENKNHLIESQTFSDYRIKFRGRFIDTFYRGIDYINLDFLNIYKSTLSLLGGVQMSLIKESHIIYIKEGKEYLKEKILKEKRKISEKYIVEFIKKNINEVKKHLEGEVFNSKFLYHLCYISHMLDNTKFNIEYLKKIKRIKYNGVSKDVLNYTNERLNIIKEFHNVKNDVII